MIVKMKKLNLVGMAYEKDAVLNALQRTGAVEVKLHREEEHSVPLPPADGELSSYHASLEDALERLTQAADAYAKELVFETYEDEPFETLDEATDTVGEATSLHLLWRDSELREEFEDTIGDFLGLKLDALIAEDELFDEEYAADCYGYCCLCDMYDCPRGGDLIARFESDGVDVRVVRVRRDSDA